MLLDIMDDHCLERMIAFPTRDKNTLDLILTSLPGEFQDINSPDKLRDHDFVSGFLRIFIPHIKKPRRKVYSCQKVNFETMREDAVRFAKEKYFNGNSGARSVQENFNLITSFTLRKPAYSNILKILPSKTENFQIKNSDIFHISAQNIDCGYSLEPPHRDGSYEYHNLCI